MIFYQNSIKKTTLKRRSWKLKINRNNRRRSGNLWWSRKNPWTWTLVGVGVASVTGGIVLGVMSNNKVDDAAHPGFDQPAAYGIIQDAEDLALGANIAFGLGGAALAGAVVLLIIDYTSKPPPVAPTVACSGSGCTAVLVGRF